MKFYSTGIKVCGFVKAFIADGKNFSHVLVPKPVKIRMGYLLRLCVFSYPLKHLMCPLHTAEKFNIAILYNLNVEVCC